MKAKINPGLEAKATPIDEPVPFGKNPRRGDVEKIAKSLTENGQYKAIICRRGTMEVLAGNHTLKAAKRLGWAEIAVDVIDVDDDDHAAQIVLVDNASNDWATYDKNTLSELLQSLPDPTYGTGYDAESMLAAINDVEQEPAEAPAGADDADPLPTEAPFTALGDVWELGPHRLICGDSTDPRVVEQLLGSERPDLMWTDPPYGVEYEGKTKEKLRIQNDGAGDLRKLLDGAFRCAAEVLKPGAPVYVAHADAERVNFEGALRAAGFLVRQNLIWVKNAMTLGRSDYHWKHEPIMEAEQPAKFNNGGPIEGGLHEVVNDTGAAIPLFSGDAGKAGKGHTPQLYGFSPGGSGRLGRGGPRWYGPNNATTVFEFPKPAASKDHPTMKPVALILAQLANSLRKGTGLIYDPFAASGSTMAAADAHWAAARLIELDPRYCDVIAMRWQKMSEEIPVCNGEPHRFPVKGEE